MALIRYFKPIAKKEDQDHGLPEPRGTLSRIIPSSSIASANMKVRATMAELKSSPSSSQRRGTYTKYTTEQKAQIGKRAAEEGVVSTIRYYAKKYPNLKESSVRDWSNHENFTVKCCLLINPRKFFPSKFFRYTVIK